MAKRWWEKSKNYHEQVIPLVKKIKNDQGARRTENLRHVKLYGNIDLVGLSSSDYARLTSDGISHKVALNVVKSCVDTGQAKIAKNSVRPMFLTEGGSPKAQKKARLLQKFIDGAFYQAGVPQKSQKVFLSGGVLGDGFLKTYSMHKQICCEWANTDELHVEQADAFYGDPRCLYQTKLVDRSFLLSKFPKEKQEINTLATNNADVSQDGHEEADMVEVVEAWRLPTSKDAGDGRHVICIEGADLLGEEWKRPNFPFAKFSWSPRLYGYFSTGIAEELTGLQIEINKILRGIQIAQHLLSTPAVYVEQGSEVITSHLNNMIGRIVKYKGTIPVVRADGAINPEIYQHLERLYQKAFEIIGISQLSAQSQKPQGLDSGKALREFHDIESERFYQVGKRWEQFHLDLAKLFIQEARSIYETEGDFEVKAKSKRFMEKIKWSEVDLDDDSFVMQIFPTSGLSRTPAGRIKDVQELLQSGFIDADVGYELLDYPDIQAYSSLKTSSRKLVRDMVEKICEDGEPQTPEPFMDLGYCVDYASMYYNRAKLDGAEESELELLSRFIETAQGMLAPPEPPGMPQPEMMPPDMGMQAPMPQTLEEGQY